MAGGLKEQGTGERKGRGWEMKNRKMGGGQCQGLELTSTFLALPSNSQLPVPRRRNLKI